MTALESRNKTMIVILEMKMPDCCDNCPFAYFSEGAFSDSCNFPDSEITGEEVLNHCVKGVPDKCPLKKFNKE